MIRIDEIYYNVFVKAMQDYKKVGLHWFDPFGSTQISNICSLPPLHIIADRRFIFYDQEPLHKKQLGDFLTRFLNEFWGPCTLITSEYNSENADWARDTYGVDTDYYFFHGWAALDWYRGYNRTFLITPPEQRQITKTFISPNRIVAGERQHRLEVLYHIFRNGMLDNHISCPAVCPAENISILDAVKPLMLKYPDAQEVFAQQKLPINFAGETGNPMHSCWLSLFDQCAESLLYLVTETVANGRRQHLTEKTFKPIAMGMPFVLVGPRGSLKYLRSYGFRTFGDIWDESYDDAEDDVRISRIASLLRSLDELSPVGKQDLFDMARPVIEHNWNHFYNGGFESILWQELTEMLGRLRVKSSV